MHPIVRTVALVVPLSLAGCATTSEIPPPPQPQPCPATAPAGAIQSEEILCREPVSNRVFVKHVLIGWNDLAKPGYTPDPRAQKRTEQEAGELALFVLNKVRTGTPIEKLMKDYSEDPGSAESGEGFEVKPDSALVSAFKMLSLRLNVNESGIVRTQYGYHVVERIE